MSDAPLGYARGVLDELRVRHQDLSHEELLDLVCTLTKEYVLDRTLPFDIPLPERAEELRRDRPDVSPGNDDDPQIPAEARFAKLIENLKERTQLPQFEGFTVENGQAVLIVDNQKIVFGERVTTSLFSRSRSSASAPAPTPARPAPTRPAAAPTGPARPATRPNAGAPTRPGAGAGAPTRGGGPFEPERARPAPASAPAPAPLLDLGDDEDLDYEDDTGVERFGGLDLD